jgi:ubiquinone/menaquinone biosynthesis C-methylase UbiE
MPATIEGINSPSDNRAPNTAATSAYWSRHVYPPNWYGFPITSKYIIASITGQTEVPLSIWLFRRYFDPLPIPRVLSICCGDGRKDVNLVRDSMWQSVDAYDVAEGSIETARHYAEECGVQAVAKFGIMDFNDPDLTESAYSLAYCNGALHHLHELERALKAIYASLLPGGYLFASEFTGPTRYAYSSHEVALINEARRMLPSELGGLDPWEPEELKAKLEADPSEAARPRDIEQVMRATFDEVDARYYGGNVLMRALGQRFFANFDDSPVHASSLLRMIEFEKHLLSAGEPSHHAYFIARRTT